MSPLWRNTRPDYIKNANNNEDVGVAEYQHYGLDNDPLGVKQESFNKEIILVKDLVDCPNQ